MKRTLLLLSLTAACGASESTEPLRTAAAPAAEPSVVAAEGCAPDSALLADSVGVAAEAMMAARSEADSRERRAARLTVARTLAAGEPGGARRAFCLLLPLYDAGVLAASGPLAELYRGAGELNRAAQLYGVDFGSGFVEDRARPVRGSLPEVGVSHRAWVRMHGLLEEHPDQRDALERAFREGARAGYGQQSTARGVTP